MMMRLCVVAMIWICLMVSGCKTPDATTPGEKTDPLPLRRLAKGEIPGLTDFRDIKGLKHALARSTDYFNRVPEKREYRFGKEIYTAGHMIRSLETLAAFLEKNPAPSDLAGFVRTRYRIYASTANDGNKVLFTGYFEPTYAGCRTKGGPYVHPLYTVPADLVEIDLSLFSQAYTGHKRLKARVAGNKVVPYFSRGEINAMADFPSRAKPLLWLENRVDRFFLEVQGSGRIRLPTGDILRVHYAGSNGNPYRSVGRYLIRKGEVKKEDMSMQAIREWLERNPGRMDEVLHHNKSLVFFKTEKGGPYGSIGVELTPFRSIATDRNVFPNGALCFIRTALPGSMEDTSVQSWPSASFFVMNQDTGGAIRGPGRADLFCGSDAYAAFTAGRMNVRGQLYFLVLAPES